MEPGHLLQNSIGIALLKPTALSKVRFAIIFAIVVTALTVPVVMHYQTHRAASTQSALEAQSTQPTPNEEPAVPSPVLRPAAHALPAVTEPASASPNPLAEIMKGQHLTDARAQELEVALVRTPEDLSARCQLLGYYSPRQFWSQANRQARQGHVQWFIQHQPELNLGNYANLNAHMDGAAYAQAKELWLQQVNENPQNLAILGNAAQFCLLNDRPIAEEFLKRAQILQPSNPSWFSQMAHLYSLDAQLIDPGPANLPAVKALEQMEYAQANTASEMQRFDNLNQLAQMAFNAGETEKARAYATELLAQSSEPQDGQNYGDAINRGNLILGRLALGAGQLNEAKQYLLASGRTAGSPVLGSFGPNMSLAKELLQRGEKETVLEYLQSCAKFWKDDKLATWTQQVKEGAMPDFGGNLVF